MSKCFQFVDENRGRVDLAALASKDGPRPKQVGLSREHILNAVDRSVERLRDVYYVGVSSATREFQLPQNVAKSNGWHQFISMQGMYSLLYRKEERWTKDSFLQMLFHDAEDGNDIATASTLDEGTNHLTLSEVDESDTTTATSASSTALSIDTDLSDADSALGIDVDRASSSASVASSVYRFVEEFGRTYHRYKEGSRLDLQHAIALRILNDELALAPIRKPHRVLDIGTGTGIWAIEFADRNPASEVLGSDLSPIQPAYVPANCRFEIDDAEDEWMYGHRFDYIHGRYLCTSIFDFPRLFGQIFDNLSPGGWVEFQETVIDFRSVDGSLQGTALRRWNDHLLEGIRRAGRDGLAPLGFAGQMGAAGFVNVQQKKFAVPSTPWARGRNQKILGAMQMTNNLEGVQGITMKIFTQVLGWTRDEAEMLLVDVRKDMADRNIHAYLTIIAVWGQKPLDEGASSTSVQS
ncbi:putative methyltransferase tdiE [Colletotrichum trifolii]|uniref:Putative methyltransferase tdiE n=1 Tax=Colletotrichum trifolii TaxID=5466 RepID=A0A4V3HWU3_COLTR|nr:putative methyltransferase tdiE [Colletotrichum trifolii]